MGHHTRGIISARGPFNGPPQPPNGILDTEFSMIKKYSFVFHALKSFLCIKKKKLKFNPVDIIKVILFTGENSY